MKKRTIDGLLIGLISVVCSTSVLAQTSPSQDGTFELLPYPDFLSLKQLPKQVTTTAPATVGSLPATSVDELTTPTGAFQPSVPTPQPTTNNSDSFNLQQLDLSELDPEIARKVASAINNIETEQSFSDSSEYTDLEKNHALYRGRLPAMNLETHMYSSDSQRRWIKINGQELREGDRFNGMILEKIQPQQVIVRFDNELIRIPALYEWQG